MIPNQWTIVLSSNQVKDDPIGVTRMGEKLVFWRDQGGNVNCIFDQCVHRGASLSQGKCINGNLQCPFHGFEYDEKGKIVHIPANGYNEKVDSNFKTIYYPTFEKNGFIWIWWGDPEKMEPQEPLFFEDIDEKFSFSQVIDPWEVHYSRVIENQLDVAHLPFVHYNTIGRGHKTLVNGPLFEWKDSNLFEVFVFNELDKGQKPKKSNELLKKKNQVKLEFQYPNLWQNHISEKIRVIGAFVPIDQEHTLLYLRFYVKIFKMGFINKFISKISMPFNVKVAHQDRRIVNNELPKASLYKSSENLIPADFPIIQFRKRRAELKDFNIYS